MLNLLGLVYFKQDKYEKAEEVYRKLAAESPDAHTLFYNLGLIYFKLGRLEEAETAFLKALELNRDNPKINFYLGSIYERLHRFQDAIYQYRQAGANLMVRRVEDKIAAGSDAPTPPSSRTTPPSSRPRDPATPRPWTRWWPPRPSRRAPRFLAKDAPARAASRRWRTRSRRTRPCARQRSPKRNPRDTPLGLT